MSQTSTSNIRQGGRENNLGATSAALWDCRKEIQKRQRDRTGEILDEPVALHGDHPPAITPEMRAQRYYHARARADRMIPRLTGAELDAVADAVRAEVERRACR